MNIYYQWELGAYSNEASKNIEIFLEKKVKSIIWKDTFLNVWEKIWKWNIWVLPVENWYAGSVHENIYNFLRYDYEIIWEYNLEVNHCLLSLEKDIKKIKVAFSHEQALSQVHNFLQKNNIKPEKKYDTAGAAKFIFENNLKNTWAIASKLSAKIYNLNIIKENISDQIWNTTKFFIIAKKSEKIRFSKKSSKISIIFKSKNIPASLYKCLWSFATNNINLTKIESMPDLKDPFSYIFFLSFEWKLEEENIKKTLEELKFFTDTIKILGEY